MSEWFKELVLKTSDAETHRGSNPTLSAIYGNMAQLVEQLTVNQWVTGSSPVIPANMLVWLNGRAADL